MVEIVSTAISRTLDFFRASQLPSGEFQTYMARDESMQIECKFDSSPFVTSIIVYALGFLQDTRATEMIGKALRFLASEREGRGVWRYWTKQHPQHRYIPPDLDDTCCVAFALKQHGAPLPSHRQLILANRNRQGLFYTWLIPRRRMPLNLDYWRVALPQAICFPRLQAFWKYTEAAPDDVDCVVNANVLLYLGECAETKPVIEYLIDIVRNQREGCCDKWHLRPFGFYYMLSRAYWNGARGLGAIKDLVEKRILRAIDHTDAWGNELETALALCTLLNLSFPLSHMHKAIEYLLATQDRRGAWRKIPLYWGGPKKYYGWGSEELTTALCLEALARWQQKEGRRA